MIIVILTVLLFFLGYMLEIKIGIEEKVWCLSL